MIWYILVYKYLLNDQYFYLKYSIKEIADNFAKDREKPLYHIKVTMKA